MPQFYYIEVGCNGVYITRTCYPDGKYLEKFCLRGCSNRFIQRLGDLKLNKTSSSPPIQGGSSDVVLCYLFLVLVSVMFLPYVCTDYFWFGFGC